jgi:hypothetical protein
MSDGTSLINIGELSKPATVLIEKVSDAMGGIFKPWQIRRVAQAEAEADKIKAEARIEITDLQQRALYRFIFEEAKKQNNIESITSKALPQVEETATPQKMEDDWIMDFFDKCKLISDEEMQVLWSKILAGEANSPGTYSKRTISLLGTMDKSDASLFQSLCNFSLLCYDLDPLIFDSTAQIYNNHGIGFVELQHLDEIGLISFNHVSGYRKMHLPKKTLVSYFGRSIAIEFVNEDDNNLNVGKVLLSRTGRELAPISGSQPIPEFLDYALEQFKLNSNNSPVLEIHIDS